MKTQAQIITIALKTEKQVFLFLSAAVAFSIPFKAIYNSVFCIALFLFWVLFMRKQFDPSRAKSIFTSSILFWIALIGMIYTQNIEEGWFRLQQKSLLLLLPLVFGSVSFDWKREFNQIILFFILGVLVACLTCLVGALLHAVQYKDFGKFFSHPFAEFVDLYPYILALLCLLSTLVLSENLLGNIEIHPRLNNRHLIILISFFSIIIFLLSVKQIILAWLISIIIYSLRINKKRFLIFVLMGGGLVLTAVSVYFIPTLRVKALEVMDTKENSIQLDEDTSLDRNWNGIAMRKAVWVCSLDAIGRNLWLGAGTGDGQDELQQAYEDRKFYFASRYNRYNTHNQYLQALVNYGIVGLAIWLISFFWLFRESKPNWLLITLISTVLFSMLTESMLETNKGVLVMAFVFSVFLFGRGSSAISKEVNHAN